MRKVSIFICFCLILLPLALAQSNTTSDAPKYYEHAKVIRVKYISGNASVQRSYDEGLETVTSNLPIFEGDRITTEDGRIEFYLGRLNYLRMDSNSELIFEKVPMLRTTSLRIRVLRGDVYLDIAQLDQEKDIEVQTGDCGIYIIEKGLYKVNVKFESNTEILLFNGHAEVCGEQESRLIRDNQRTVMRNGEFLERPYYFNSTLKEDFDLWNKKRMGSLEAARYSSSRYLDEGYEDYEYELNRNGRWKYNSTYGRHVWIPYNVAVDWRPYYHGRWVWNPFYGYVWSSYHPWGWFTHHYGRWHWSSFYGWHWLPGYYWSPAWVSWYYDSFYYGWCPLSIYNRPVIVLNRRWMRGYRFRDGIPLHATSAVVVKKKSLMAPKISKVMIKDTSGFKKGQILKYNGSALKVKPATIIKSKNLNKKEVVFNKKGVQVKRYGVKGKDVLYKTPKTDTGVIKKSSPSSYKKEKTVKIYGSSKSSKSKTPVIKKTKSSSGTKKAVKKKKGTSDKIDTGKSANHSYQSYGAKKTSYGYTPKSSGTKYKRYTSKSTYPRSSSSRKYSSYGTTSYKRYKSKKSSSSGSSSYRQSRSSSSSSRSSSSKSSSGSRSSRSSSSSSSSSKSKKG